MKVLVTGCAGFIGSHLAERLLRGGAHVIGVDGFLDNYDAVLKQRNLSSFLHHPNFTFFPALLQNGKWDEWLNGVEVIYHQAALPGVRTSWGKAFSDYCDHNLTLTQELLEASMKHSTIQKIVIASSSSVYGTMQDGPTDESAPLQPVSPYGVTKLAMEALCQVYAHAYHLPIVLLRYFTVYGPRQRPDMSFHRFLRQMIAGEELSIYGHGRQTRDFTYVSDAVEANILAAQRAMPGEVYNIGGNLEIALIDVIQLMEKLLQTPAKLAFLGEQVGDSRRTCADIQKARMQLGYEPQVSLEVGLRQQVKDVSRLYGFVEPKE